NLEAATAAERGAFGRLLDQVRGQLEAAGFRASPEILSRVTAPLRGAAADPARQDELRSGLLKAELRAPGFEALAGGALPAEIVGRPEKPALRPPATETVASASGWNALRELFGLRSRRYRTGIAVQRSWTGSSPNDGPRRSRPNARWTISGTGSVRPS